jgi:hypothetical protein
MSASPDSQPRAGDEGQAPQAGNPTTPLTPQAGKPSDLEALTPTELAQMVRDLRRESGGYRTKLTKFEQDERDRQQAQLSEVEKRDARIRELEGHLTAAQTKERDYALRDGIAEIVARDDFPATPVASGARLLKLLDPDAIQWSEDGTPKNLPRQGAAAGAGRRGPLRDHPERRRHERADPAEGRARVGRWATNTCAAPTAARSCSTGSPARWSSGAVAASAT